MNREAGSDLLRQTQKEGKRSREGLVFFGGERREKERRGEKGGRHTAEGGHLVHLQVYSYSTMLSVILGIAPQDVFVDLLGVFLFLFLFMLLVPSPLH